MKNQVFDAVPTMSLPVPAGTKAGDPVQVGGLCGVASTDRADSAAFATNPASGAWGGGNPDGWATVKLSGAFSLAVTAAGAPEVGDPVYYNAGTLNTSATGDGWGLVIPGASQALPVDNGDGTWQCTVMPVSFVG